MHTPAPHDVEIAHELCRALRTRAAVRLAILFGSHARGQETPTSDVDLAVISDGADLLGLAAELGLLLGRNVDVIDLTRADIPLLSSIVRDGIVVHQGTPGAAASWRCRTLADLEIDRPWYRRMRDAWLARVATSGIDHG